MASQDRIAIHDQENLLPKRQVVVVFAALASALLIVFIDQNSIGIALPTIGRELDAASTIEWAGTSSMISNTAFQVLYGRFSDVFGRKVLIISMLGFLCLGDLLSGFAQTGPQLYAFRAISGMASGGIMALAMMITSDIVTLRERGRYQGILGSCVGLGNAVGPFIAAGFTQHSSWRNTFYMLAPMCAVSAGILYWKLPAQNMPKEDFRVTVRKIDWIGLFLASFGTILLLIPMSGIGTQFKASSPMVISMMTIGGIFLVLFVVNEWKWAGLPMIPLRFFKNIPLAAMLMQNFLIGVVWYSILYFMPIFYQSARQMSLLTSAALMVPLVLGLAIASTASGQYISRMNRYGEVIWLGLIVWTLTTGLHCMFTRTTPVVAIACILAIEGLSIGMVFQPTLVAAQAHTAKPDRAVVISTRNFIRSLGGAVGLAISSAIFANSLHAHLPSSLPASLTMAVHKSTFSAPDVSHLDLAQRNAVLDAYAKASRTVFIMWAGVMGACLLCMVFVKDKGLHRKEESQVEKAESNADLSDAETTKVVGVIEESVKV